MVPVPPVSADMTLITRLWQLANYEAAPQGGDASDHARVAANALEAASWSVDLARVLLPRRWLMGQTLRGVR